MVLIKLRKIIKTIIMFTNTPTSSHQSIEIIEKRPTSTLEKFICFKLSIDKKKILKNNKYRGYLVEKCDVS